MRQVLFQRAAETEAQGLSNLPMFRRTTLWLTIVSLLPTAAIMIAGPWLFSTVLGAEWHEAGVYARWLALWVGCMIMNVPAVAVLQVLRRQKLLMVLEIVLFVGRTVALLVAAILGNAQAAIAAYAGVGAAFNLALIGGTDLILRRGRRESDSTCPA